MNNSIVADMTRGEFREMLQVVVSDILEQKLAEIFIDPDEGLEIRERLLTRLLRQKQAVASRERGLAFEDVTQDLGLN
ncbi:MAG: hypothetical protein B6245_02800 [Desulfobacteraceae bacterium 4572_88]|nr:MAG: hypothetical protein B6245_02800 [Desulfobacteraceae bacterium 4572_88]